MPLAAFDSKKNNIDRKSNTYANLDYKYRKFCDVISYMASLHHWDDTSTHCLLVSKKKVKTHAADSSFNGWQKLK